MKRRKNIPYLKAALALSILAVILTVYAALVEPNLVSQHVVNISDGDLGTIFYKKKVVQISDLHITSIGYREKKLIKMLNRINPDLLFITGDFLTNGIDEKSCIEVLRQIRKPSYGIWSVLGNADRYYNDDEANEKLDRFARKLRELGIRVLRNTCEPLLVGDQRDCLFIVGVEGTYLSRSKLNWLLNDIPSGAPVIMLSHYPDILQNHTDALPINLEEAEGKGVTGWGWQDHAFFEYDTGIVRFENNGKHRLRVQRREDGVAIERICLIPSTHPAYTLSNHLKKPLNVSQVVNAPSNLDDPTVITIKAKDVPDSNIFGSWKKVLDSTATTNPVLKDISASDVKNEFPLVSPDHYFEATFYATSSLDYHVLVKMKAENDLISNDSVYLQFDDSINEKGEPIFRIGEVAIRSGLKKVNLILAGHTHGGQIRFPIIGALDHVPNHKIIYDMGLFQGHGTQMYVNRGIGTVILPMRFLCTPEITVFQFSRAKNPV